MNWRNKKEQQKKKSNRKVTGDPQNSDSNSGGIWHETVEWQFLGRFREQSIPTRPNKKYD